MVRVVQNFLLTVTIVSAMLSQLSLAQVRSEPKKMQAQSEHAKHDIWWRHAVIYEVYPRSFADSNRDGVGDLNGITDHLDYLHSLGADAIWLAPIYSSPQVDFGYDISDYTDIDPQYGTLADFDRLRAEAEKRHIRLVLDMVLNHTSDQSAWFKESAGSRDNPKANWYVWSDGISASGPDLPSGRRATSMTALTVK